MNYLQHTPSFARLQSPLSSSSSRTSFFFFFYFFSVVRGLTDESEILKFLQHGTLVGLLPVPHPILIRKYQVNAVTSSWFHTYTWGVVYLR